MARLVSLLLIIVGIASAPLQLVSSRDLVSEAQRMYAMLEPPENFTFMSRIFNSIIAVLLILIMTKIITKRIHLTPNTSIVIVSLGAYLVLNYGLGSLFGSHPGSPDLYLVLTMLVLMMLVLIKGLSPQMLINVFRYVAGFMVLGSLFSGIFFPEWAYMAEVSYDFGDGFSKRLIGFFNHPSVLGLYALMLFIVELLNSRVSVLRIFNLIACSAVLVMSMSKTAVILAIFILCCHLLKKAMPVILAVILVGVHLAKKKRVVFFAVVFSAAILFSSLGAPEKLVSLFKNNESFTTLTGRTGLWDFLINSWLDNPIFGNGPALFSATGKTGFAHAHNIILQAMSDGGLFGLLGLFFYLYAIFRVALWNRAGSNGLSVLLVVAIFFFSLSEPVTRVDSFLNGLFFVNGFVLLYLCALDRCRRKQMASQLPLRLPPHSFA